MEKLTTEYVRNVVESFGCEFVGEYVGAFTKINVRCPCGNMLQPVLFHSFALPNKSHRCEQCYKKLYPHQGYRRIVNADEIIERFNVAGYFVLDTSEVKGTTNKINLGDNDGYNYKMSLNRVEQCYRRGLSIRRFGKANPYTFDNMNLWAEINRESYRILDNWYSETGDIIAKLCCSMCNTKWNVRWSKLLCSGCVCPTCQMSIGEMKIKTFLEINGIRFIPQYRFKDCRGTRNPLPFDFYLQDYNVLCEYDGVLHFYDKFNDSKNFEAVQRNDEIKTRYCLDHDIPLLRIPYWQRDDIDSILTSYLNL